MNRFKYFFSGKRISFLIVLAAITGRTIQLIFFHNIRVDRSFQLMAMQNLVHGHGVSLAHVLPSDLSATIYEPLIKWPPGYSLLIAPFYLLFNQDYFLASLIVEILFAIVLIVFCRKILSVLEVPVYLINGFTLLCGFFIYEFYVITNTDAITATFFIAALYFALLVLKSQENRFRNLLLLTVLLYACGLLKYLFIPVIFIVPVFLLLYGFLKNDKTRKKAGAIVFFALAAGICALLIYQKSVGGAATYISQPERGFFPANLLSFFPYLPASFIKPGTIETAGAPGAVMDGFRAVHLVMLCAILAAFVFLFSKKKFQSHLLKTSFFGISFLVTAAISLVLMFLSVRVAKEETFPGVFWTYVEEARYYGAAVILIQLSVFLLCSFHSVKKGVRYLLFFLMLLFAVEIAHGVFFDLKRIWLFQKEEYGWQYEARLQKYADSVLQNGKKKYATGRTVLTGSSYYMNHRISLYSHAPLLSDVHSINNLPSIKAKQPVLLLIMLNKNDLVAFQPFLSSGAGIAGQFRDFYFYTVYVRPD